MKNSLIDFDELRKIEFNLLQQFDDICNKHDFKYSISAGTLLGSIRHKGFIPWDDDIDVLMPREDYRKFIEYCCNNKTAFVLASIYNNEKYGYLFSKIYDPRTKVIELYGNRLNCDMGVCIDIFPVDGYGDTLGDARHTHSIDSLRREILIASNWKKFFLSKTHKRYLEPIRFVLFIISRFVNPNKYARKLEKRLQKYSNSNYKYSGIYSSSYRAREILDSKVYNTFATNEFEGRKFSALEYYDEYLSCLYGDYMQLPPKDKRVTHHTFDAYWRD